MEKVPPFIKQMELNSVSWLTVKKLLEKKNTVKLTWRSILEICIHTNT